MPLVEARITNRYSITAYGADHVMVNETPYHGSLILSATAVIAHWSVTDIEQLDESSFTEVLKLNPEVVLLGTGETQIFPAPKIFALFGERGIGLEVMNTGALCRTFNILAAEDREVVAAIIQN